MRSALWTFSLMTFALGGGASLLPAQSAGDKAAVEALVQSQGDAWNRGDAEAFGAHYAEDGSFTNILGQQLYGRKAFIRQHAIIFSTIYKGTQNTLSVTKVQFVRPDVAVVDIEAVLHGAKQLPPGVKAADDGALHTKLQEVMTKERGGWMIVAFHNVAVSPMTPPQ